MAVRVIKIVLTVRVLTLGEAGPAADPRILTREAFKLASPQRVVS